MKIKASIQEIRNIQRGKRMLRHLWKTSGIKQAQTLQALSEQGLEIKKTTFSMWLSLKEGNHVRPQKEALLPLIELFCQKDHSEDQKSVILNELDTLFFGGGLLSTQMLQNKIEEELDQDTSDQLSFHQTQLEGILPRLEELLHDIEEQVFQYDRGYPAIRVDADDKRLLRELLGKDKSLWKPYQADEGDYEVPLTQVKSMSLLTEIINHLNEGIRLLRAYIERSLLEHGTLSLGYPRVEDFVGYTWEISDRLLNNNILCKSVPTIKATLLRLMATCQGIVYLLKNQSASQSEIGFQNVLKLKGTTSQASIDCSVAVFMGTLVRQLLRHGSVDRRQEGLKVMKKARALLQAAIPKLKEEQEQFFYTKELGNLAYDSASLLLWHQSDIPKFEGVFQDLMATAHQSYKTVLQTSNLFYQGLTEVRALHLRVFYLISFCWVTPDLKAGVEEINKLNGGMTLNEMYWMVKIAQAIGYAVLGRRSSDGSDAEKSYLKASQDFLYQAKMVPGFAEQTEAEIESEYILHRQ